MVRFDFSKLFPFFRSVKSPEWLLLLICVRLFAQQDLKINACHGADLMLKKYVSSVVFMGRDDFNFFRLFLGWFLLAKPLLV